MFFAAALLAVIASPAPSVAHEHTLLEVLDAIRVVETRGTPNSGRDSGGDSGRAIGPFQIDYSYWKDAGLPGKYEDCRDMDYARRVVLAYWRRYCPNALAEHDAEILARTHNGGPSGAKRDSTLPFWKKVQKELDKAPPVPSSRPADAPAPAHDASAPPNGASAGRRPTEIALEPERLCVRTLA